MGRHVCAHSPLCERSCPAVTPSPPRPVEDNDKHSVSSCVSNPDPVSYHTAVVKTVISGKAKARQVHVHVCDACCTQCTRGEYSQAILAANSLACVHEADLMHLSHGVVVAAIKRLTHIWPGAHSDEGQNTHTHSLLRTSFDTRVPHTHTHFHTQTFAQTLSHTHPFTHTFTHFDTNTHRLSHRHFHTL